MDYKVIVVHSDVTSLNSTQAVRVQIEMRVWKKLLPFIRNSTLSPSQSLLTITTLLSFMKKSLSGPSLSNVSTTSPFTTIWYVVSTCIPRRLAEMTYVSERLTVKTPVVTLKLESMSRKTFPPTNRLQKSAQSFRAPTCCTVTAVMSGSVIWKNIMSSTATTTQNKL